ncbi:AbrB/MazE/SpoVT family DNA-binding domain-containing protein [Bradyrhizobium cenepequi]|jgi:AbrB family looped-hinge helix DNA binding protein
MPNKVTEDGRVTVPKWVRDHLGLAIGTEVVFRPADNGSIVIERADGTQLPNRFAKIVGNAGPGLSTDELMSLLRDD